MSWKTLILAEGGTRSAREQVCRMAGSGVNWESKWESGDSTGHG